MHTVCFPVQTHISNFLLADCYTITHGPASTARHFFFGRASFERAWLCAIVLRPRL